MDTFPTESNGKGSSSKTGYSVKSQEGRRPNRKLQGDEGLFVIKEPLATSQCPNGFGLLLLRYLFHQQKANLKTNINKALLDRMKCLFQTKCREVKRCLSSQSNQMPQQTILFYPVMIRNELQGQPERPIQIKSKRKKTKQQHCIYNNPFLLPIIKCFVHDHSLSR